MQTSSGRLEVEITQSSGTRLERAQRLDRGHRRDNIIGSPGQDQKSKWDPFSHRACREVKDQGWSYFWWMVEVGSAQKPVEVLSSPSHPSISAGEKPGFLAPRDLPKHTPLISKSQSLRSVHGAGSWARPRLEEEQPPRLPRPVQRTQSVPAGRPARRRPSAGPRPQPKGSLQAGPAPRGRPWTGASASLPRKPSVPWQRQMDQPRDKDQALGTHRPVGKVRCTTQVCA